MPKSNISGMSEGWSSRSSGSMKPEHPFYKDGSVELFYANGGTSAQHVALLESYYASFHRGVEAVHVSTGCVKSGAAGDGSTTSGELEVSSAAVKVDSWNSGSSLGRDPPGMSKSEFDRITREKEPLVRSYGNGFCYLFAIKREFIDFVAFKCEADSGLLGLIEYSDYFESDAYLAMLRVEVLGTKGHVEPWSTRGTRFLTLCRALEPGMASSEFVERMAVYKPSGASEVVRSGLVLGGAVGDVGPCGHAVFYDNHRLQVIVPDVVEPGRGYVEMAFTSDEVCQRYQGLVSDAVCAGEYTAVFPTTFDHGYVYVPVGLEVKVLGGWEAGPLVARIQSGNCLAFRQSVTTAGLWLNVLTSVRPNGVKVRQPVDGDADLKALEAVKRYDAQVSVMCSGVKLGRGFDEPGSVVVLNTDDDFSQIGAVRDDLEKFIDKAVKGGWLRHFSSAWSLASVARKISYEGIAIVVTVSPAYMPAMSSEYDRYVIKGEHGMAVTTTCVVGGGRNIGGKLSIKSATVSDSGHLVIDYSYQLDRNCAPKSFDVEFELGSGFHDNMYVGGHISSFGT